MIVVGPTVVTNEILPLLIKIRPGNLYLALVVHGRKLENNNAHQEPIWHFIIRVPRGTPSLKQD